MPIYEEKIKDKKTGKMIPKLVDGKKQYYIRTYVEDEFGNKKQIWRRNKKWLGLEGKILAQREELKLKNISLTRTDKNKLTIHQLKDKYLQYCSSQIDEDSLKSKETKLNHFCEIDETEQVKTYPNMLVTKYTKEMFQMWKKQMKEKQYAKANIDPKYLKEWQKDKKDRKYKWVLFSIKYLNKVYNEICSMLDFGVSEGICQYNFAKQSGKIGTAKEIKLSEKKKEYTVITFNEYLKLMEVSKNDLKYNTAFDLFFTKGVRPGELRAFQIKDHDYKNHRIMVNHTMSKKNELKPPKTAASNDWIENLNNELNEKLHCLILNLKQQQEFNENWFIFGGEKPISSHALDYNKDKYFNIANINKHIKLHEFRHSSATWMHSIGIDIAVISKILRHSNIAITMETYTHLFEEDYYNGLKKINDYKTSAKTSAKHNKI